MIAELEVPEVLSGERLDRVVAALTGCSRTEATEVIKAGQVTLDGAVATSKSRAVQSGSVIGLSVDPNRSARLPEGDASVPINVIFEDEHLIILNKSPGLVVHPAPGHETGTLVNGLLALYPEIASVGEPFRPGIVHRLDRGTSGVMMVARTQDAYESLVDQLRDHSALRRYVALTLGHAEHAQGSIDAPVGRSRRDPLKMAVTREGRHAITHYRVEQRYHAPRDVTLIECVLETGRTHQIRLHLRSIGLPVVGDPAYGRIVPEFQLDRPFLHAAQLALSHPETGEPVSFEAPLPDDLRDVLATCSIPV